MSNDITIIVSIVLFMMLVGAAIPVINDSFSSTYNTTANGTILYNAASNRISADIDCDKWYAAEFLQKFGNPIISSAGYASNYGLNWSTNNTGIFGQFQNFFASIYNFGANLFGHSDVNYTTYNYTMNTLNDTEAANLGLEPCPDATYGSQLSVWKIIGSMFTSIFWTFGVADWINLFILLPLRLLLLLLIARNIWIGGGG